MLDWIPWDKIPWDWIRLAGGLIGIIFIVRFVLASPFKEARFVEKLILEYGGTTTFGLLVTMLLGIGLTCAVHSSSLVTWTVISLVAGGAIPIHVGIAFVLGANLGTTIDAAIASQLFKQHDAQIVAYSHILFNLVGISIMFPIFLLVRHWIK